MDNRSDILGNIRDVSVRKVELVLKAVYPEMMSTWMIRKTTNVHYYTLPRVLEYLEGIGKVEKLSTTTDDVFWRWRNNE